MINKHTYECECDKNHKHDNTFNFPNCFLKIDSCLKLNCNNGFCVRNKNSSSWLVCSFFFLFKYRLFYLSVCHPGWTGSNCLEEKASWESWKKSSECLKTCVLEPTRLETRSCSSPNILDCVKNANEKTNYKIEKCDKRSCELIGLWTSWSSWSACENKCGNENSTIERYCYYNKTILFEQSGSFEKLPCAGDHVMFRSCNHYSCASFISFQVLTSFTLISLVFVPFFKFFFKPLYEQLKKVKANYDEKMKKIEERKGHKVKILVTY